MVEVDAQFTEKHLEMRISLLSIKIEEIYQWLMLDQIPMDRNSSFSLVNNHT
jgi:hypothetical protein